MPIDDSDDRIRIRTLAAVEANSDWFVSKYLRAFGTVLNGDNASESFDEYAATGETRARHGRAVRPAATAVIERVYRGLLAEPVPDGKLPLVLFTSGGNGVGKSTGIDPNGLQHITFDSTLSLLEPSMQKIEQALAAGHDVRIRHIAREPVAAWRGTLDRAAGSGEGRTVTITGHLQTHRGARETVLALADRYADDSRVTFVVDENTPAGLVPRSLDWLREERYPDLDGLRATLEQVLEDAHASGAISDAVYAGAKGDTRRPQADRSAITRDLREAD